MKENPKKINFFKTAMTDQLVVNNVINNYFVNILMNFFFLVSFLRQLKIFRLWTKHLINETEMIK